ncbi:MAG: hypothetical protein L6R38_004880 [Xanthoria sp. 2 TBL-2021]|nr:MAG: hypothetical protein L6R38_004880 [Xanthoria sp. 2 TBL-2021]
MLPDLILLFHWLLVVQGRGFEQQHPVTTPASPSLLQHRLNFSSPAPHIFSSVHGLLRQGYNVLFPNGFSVVPCEIPAFTPFYHGWLNDELPQSPEWLASTPEMAYGIMGSTRNSFLSTYQTTRPVKCIYFDGASGALGENGTMDMQMLFLYGNTTGPPGKHSGAKFLWDEYARAQQLCGWLQEHGLDVSGQGVEGIVRMSAGFELIWCNFSSPSIRLVSKFNASVPLLDYNRTSSLMGYSCKRDRALDAIDQGTRDDLPAPDWEIDWEHEPFVASQQWDWFTTTSRTYSSGDLASTREPSIRLRDAELVSLYSPEYHRHLIELVEHEREHLNLTVDGLWRGGESPQSRQNAMNELMRRRARQRVGNISPQEIDSLRSNIKRMVTRVVSEDPHDDQEWHAISWSHTCDLIVDNFAERLMQLQRLLEQDFMDEREPPVSARRRFTSLRERAHALLIPFFDYSLGLEASSSVQQQTEKIHASLDRCKRRYLPWPVHSEASTASPKGLPSNHFVAQAIEDVMDNICTVLIGAGISIEKTWLRNFNHKLQKPNQRQQQLVRDELRVWHENIEQLTAWLGWSPHWMGCGRLCAWNVSNPG